MRARAGRLAARSEPLREHEELRMSKSVDWYYHRKG